MKNRLVDLNNHLFDTLERLKDTALNPEQLDLELSRAKAISDVSDKIIEIAKTSLQAAKLQADYLGSTQALPVYFSEPQPIEVKKND
ncbi:MAG: hypothetical protein SOX56_09475 [[Pasteurella] mairii]|uniref:EAL domain-containing protein n=1 Tax=[Pasteurella] mairii TaxID=757 RepID=A0A379B138_9PAST|nr:hypothetical protein [[Pasteurella] mairii]SUB28757.1 Uncharacterised protein [[Pasteurella] mairii]SUB33370.1 Uncharacterised protein [[Pasteurella] mairii]